MQHGDMSTTFASDPKFWENFGALRATANFESNFGENPGKGQGASARADGVRCAGADGGTNLVAKVHAAFASPPSHAI